MEEVTKKLDAYEIGSASGTVTCHRMVIAYHMLNYPEKLQDVLQNDAIQSENLRNVTRIAWGNILSGFRVPTFGYQILEEAWPVFDLVNHLTDIWCEKLWTSGLLIPAHFMTFEMWFMLYAEGIRARKAGNTGQVLRVVEECHKHLVYQEKTQALAKVETPSVETSIPTSESSASDLASVPDSDFTKGIRSIISFYAPAAAASPLCNEPYALMRYFLSSLAVLGLRAVYRQPTVQEERFGLHTYDRGQLLRRCLFYTDMQRTAEDELRGTTIPSTATATVNMSPVGVLFGDGNADWTASWIYTQTKQYDQAAAASRRAVKLADAAGGNNDFVSAKAR